MSEELFPPEAFSIELAKPEQFRGLVNGVLNHEAKILTTLLMAGDPTHWFRVSDLHQQMQQSQGVVPAWDIHNTAAGGYCEHSLAPSGVVTEGTVHSDQGDAKAFRLTNDFGALWGVAFAAGGAIWSLRYEHTSVQRLLGASSSSEDVKAPEFRVALLRALMDGRGGEMSYTDIYERLDSSRYAGFLVQHHMKDLQNMGIVQVRTVQDTFNPIFSFVRPEYHHVSIPFDDAKPATQLIYTVVDEFVSAGKSEATLEDIATACIVEDKTVDPIAIRKNLIFAARRNGEFYPGMQVTDRNGAPLTRSAASITEPYKEPIDDLLRTIDQASNSANLHRFIQMGRHIVADPASCYELMRKARAFSPHASHREGRQEKIHEIINILKEKGPLPPKAIHKELGQRGLEMTQKTASRLLGSLAANESLECIEVQKDRTKRRKTRIYRIPEE